MINSIVVNQKSSTNSNPIHDFKIYFDKSYEKLKCFRSHLVQILNINNKTSHFILT